MSTERTAWALLAANRKASHLADTAIYDIFSGYESLLCAGKDKGGSWLSMPLLDVSEAGAKSRTVGKQLNPGDGYRDGEEADGVMFRSSGETDTRATLPISPKTLPGETYAESLFSFGKAPLGSKDEAREDCCYTRTPSILYQRKREQGLVPVKE